MNFKDEKNDVGEGSGGSWNIGVASKQLDENTKKKKVAKVSHGLWCIPFDYSITCDENFLSAV